MGNRKNSCYYEKFYFNSRIDVKVQPDMDKIRNLYVNNSALGIIAGLYDEGCSFCYVSQTFLDIIGYTYDEFVITFEGHLSNVVYEEDRDIFEKYTTDMNRSLREYRLVHKSGTLIWVSELGVDMHTEAGNTVWIASVRPLDSKQRVDAHSEYVTRALLNQFMVVYEIDLVYRRIYCVKSSTAENEGRLFDFDFINSIFDKHYNQYDAERLKGMISYRNLFREWKKGTQHLEGVFVKKLPDGKKIVVRNCFEFEHGTFNNGKVVFTQRDITKEYEGRMALQCLSDTYSEIGYINLTDNTVVNMNRDGKPEFIQKYNDSMNFQLNSGNILEEDVDKIRKMLDRNAIISELKLMDRMSTKYRHIRPDGTLEWRELSLNVFERDEKENPAIVLLTVQSIDELMTTVEIAKRANAAKSEFFAKITHNLRTPLNGILGMLDIAGNSIGDADKCENAIEKAGEAARYLSTLLEDILDVTEIKAGGLIMEDIPFNFSAELSKCLDAMELIACGREISYHSHIGNITYDRLHGSPKHFRKVLIKVISNAIKFNSNCGSVDIYVDEKCHTPEVVTYAIRVVDTGIGMSEDYIRNHLFHEFAQENENAGQLQGVGLGMVMVKEILRKMGGTISVKSIVNTGTTVELVIPFVIDNSLDMPVVEQSVSGMNILVVEDNALNMEIVTYMLEKEGVKYICAKDGREAVECFEASQEGSIDAILMDIMMPVMNGYDASRKIRSLDRADAKQVAIIAMTANNYAEDIEKSKKAGMNFHLEKPVDADKMFKALCLFRK